jgi:hypothetical protein
MAENMSVAPAETGARIARNYCERLAFCGSTFPCGFGAGATVEQAIMAYPEFEEHRPHLMALMAHGARDSRMIELVLFSATENGSRVVPYRLSGGEGSVREFTACNTFVNHGPYLSVADVDQKVLYVTMLPEQMAPGWTYKLVLFDDILKYIVALVTLDELDALAEGEQRARDELAELREQNRELDRELAEAERLRSNELIRADLNADALRRLADWVEPIFARGVMNLLARGPFQDRIRLVRRVLKDRKIEGVTLVGLINGHRDPIDPSPRLPWIGLREKKR